MADIYHQVGVKADVKKVYHAITTLKGLTGWWTHTTGNTDINEKLYLHSLQSR